MGHPSTKGHQASLREHGLTDLNAVRLAVLETSGEVGVIPVEGAQGQGRAEHRGEASTGG